VVEFKAGTEAKMYTGTLIEELIETVERAERHEAESSSSQKAYYELDSSLLGVA
jgi:hypothetical protein